ncbi:hypothetical protein PA01_12840 [Azoarcus sp. PA01]|nr:hypothetical protein PA01_12840 [Azoarcus sp. PA01]
MTITLTVGATVLALDPDLQWSDEYTWAATEQSVSRSLTGALIIQTAQRLAGRPITLQNEDERSGWMTRADMAQLQAWADTPGQRMTLTLRGTPHLVVFRHHDGGPFEARPLVHYADPLPADWVLATLRFTTLSE